MEAFTLLKYWRTSGGTGGGTTALFTGNSTFNKLTSTAAGPYSDYGFDGPYFDLELADETSETTETESESGADEGLSETEDQGKASGDPLTFDVAKVKGPLVFLFARDNSPKTKHGERLKRSMQDSDTNSASEEQNLGKEVLHKYLNMLKPLYIRVSSRYVEKMKFSGQVNFPGIFAVSPPCTAASERGRKVPKAAAAAACSINVKAHNLQAGLKVVCKHLAKRRSTSAMVASPPHGKMGRNRRDDSLLELQDGIEGAILHCKRSFNANREGESAILSC